MAETYWLREETKKNEFRRALTPDSCLKLIDAGHSIFVEQWDDSIIPIEEYERVGCKISKAGSWVNSPKETIIVGLKALPDNIDTFIHRHIFFAHVFKEQDGWKELLQKFKQVMAVSLILSTWLMNKGEECVLLVIGPVMLEQRWELYFLSLGI
jgi:alanine dehydrogenase